jgi:hypothetical protein
MSAASEKISHYGNREKCRIAVFDSNGSIDAQNKKREQASTLQRKRAT